MLKEKEKENQISAEKDLNDEELEHVTGGQIELVQDEPINSVGGRINTNPLSRGDYQA